MNKFEFFTPLMHKHEYEFIKKYLNKDDILLEYGSGSGTIYFSGIVNKVIAIEHDTFWFDKVKSVIDNYSINNIELYQVNGRSVENQKLHRHIAFKDYIKFPKDRGVKFNKVLIDGRARKHCAEFIAENYDENVIVFIHDFNFNNVEGYDDEDYFSDILKKYDIIEFERSGQGIVALKKKTKSDIKVFESRIDMFKSFKTGKIIAEVGVFRGDFSEFIYSNLNPMELHLIDIFNGITHSGDKDGKNVITIDLNESYESLLEKYKDKNVKIHKGLSDKILNSFDDNYFDIIYIDAGHSYEEVKKDLEVSYNKLKPGGILSGHDYEPKRHIEVFMAVSQFCFENNLKIEYLTNDGCPSYAIIK
jgi:precorrin-6B methylase 2